jgi:hypothetical protein
MAEDWSPPRRVCLDNSGGRMRFVGWNERLVAGRVQNTASVQRVEHSFTAPVEPHETGRTSRAPSARALSALMPEHFGLRRGNQSAFRFN